MCWCGRWRAAEIAPPESVRAARIRTRSIFGRAPWGAASWRKTSSQRRRWMWAAPSGICRASRCYLAFAGGRAAAAGAMAVHGGLATLFADSTLLSASRRRPAGRADPRAPARSPWQRDAIWPLRPRCRAASPSATTSATAFTWLIPRRSWRVSSGADLLSTAGLRRVSRPARLALLS